MFVNLYPAAGYRANDFVIKKNMMTNAKLKLISRYFSSDCKPAERARVEKWINSCPENREFFDRLKRVWELTGSLPGEVEYSRPLKKLNAMLRKDEPAAGMDGNLRLVRIERKPAAVDRGVSFRSVLRFAAVFVALFGTLFVAQFLKEKAIEKKASERTMMFASGEASTGQGQQMTLRLVDGTKIVLNSASQVRYDFRRNGARDVYLEGEAYFEVVHSRRRPFTVYVRNETIKDVGTRFDVEAWSDEKNTRVAVVEGAVAIHPKSGIAHEILVVGNQECVVNNSGVVLPPISTDAARFVDWINGKVVFHDASMSEVIKQLRHRYGLYCTVADTSILSQRITAVFDKGDPSKRVLRIIAVTMGLTCRVSGDSVIFLGARPDILQKLPRELRYERQ